MRGESKRAWVKLHINGMLNGSVRYQLEPAERSVWVDLLCFAGIGTEPGTISDNDLRPYPHSFLANRFNIPIELLEDTLKKCKEEGRIGEDQQGIHIANWADYQSEYQRQKPSRVKAKHNAQWDAMSTKEKAIAIEAFGPVESWDEMNWIAATGKLSDEDAERINQGIIKEGGKPLPF